MLDFLLLLYQELQKLRMALPMHLLNLLLIPVLLFLPVLLSPIASLAATLNPTALPLEMRPTIPPHLNNGKRRLPFILPLPINTAIPIAVKLMRGYCMLRSFTEMVWEFAHTVIDFVLVDCRLWGASDCGQFHCGQFLAD